MDVSDLDLMKFLWQTVKDHLKLRQFLDPEPHLLFLN